MTKFLDAAGITRLVGGIIDGKEYSHLETTNKTISGAINELKKAGGGGGALPEEYYQETYLKIQVPNSLDWTLIPAYETWIIIALTSSNGVLESVDPYLDGSGTKTIRYIDYNIVDSNDFPYYAINNIDNTWRLYTNYDEYTEETPVINEEDFTSIEDLDAFDAIIDSFKTHTENQSFQLKFAAEKLTAGEGIVIDNQNKINSSLVGEVLSKSWTETDLGISLPGYYSPYNLNINLWIIVPDNYDGYSFINFRDGFYGSVYEDNPIYLASFSEIEWELGGQVVPDFNFLPEPSDINYIYLNGPKPYFTYNGTTYAINSVYGYLGKVSITLEELNFTNISPNVTASVYMGEKSFIYDDNGSNYYLNYQDMENQLNLEVTFLDSEGNTTYPYFLMHSYLYQWNDNIYLWDTNSYPGFLVYYNIDNDVVEDRVNNTVTITLHEISAESLGFNITFFDSYDELQFYLNGYFASSFWRKKFINPNTLEDIDNLYFDFVYNDLYSNYPKLHYKLNKETGLWESRIRGDYFLAQGSGESIFPNRFAVEAMTYTNALFCLNTSYFYGPVEIGMEGADVSDWTLHFRFMCQETHEGLVPNIFIYEHPEFSVLPKLISPTEYISILDTNKIIFKSNLVLNKYNVFSSFGSVIPGENDYTITSRATRSFSINSFQCLALSISYDYQGSLSFSFVDPIKETGKLVDNVKVYFSVNDRSVSAYCIYAGIGTVKPKITYKIIPISEMWHTGLPDYLNHYQNDTGSEEVSALCFKVDLGLHDGVSLYAWFADKYPEEKAKYYNGMVEFNMTVNSFTAGTGCYYKILESPLYYERNNQRGDYYEYATPALKYLPYMRDINTVVSATTEPPIVIFGNQTDQTTGDPIPNPDYVNYDNIWTEVPEKTGLIV